MLYLVNFHVHSSALALLHSAPLDLLVLLSSSRSSSLYVSVLVSVLSVLSVSTPYALAFSQSMPAWSHHLSDTFAPSLGLALLHISRSGHVAMYCAAVFCLISTDVRISVNTASFMPPSCGG